MEDEPTRRRLLAATGTAVAASTLAGCSAIPGLNGSGSGDDVRTWVPTPASPSNLRGSYASYDVGQIHSMADTHDAISTDWIEDEIVERLPNRDVTALDTVTSLDSFRADSTYVIAGDFEDYGSELEDASYERIDTVNDVPFYERGNYTVAVTHSRLVFGRDREYLERSVRANTGDVPNALEANEHLKRLTDAIGSGDYVYVYTYPESDGEDPDGLAHFDGQVGAGSALTLTEDGYDATVAFVFVDAAATDVDAVRAYMTDGSFRRRNEHRMLADRSVSKTDRVVTVTGTGDLENI